jgi:hypothetical protein
MYAKDADTVVGSDAGWVDSVKVGSPPVFRGVVVGGPFKVGKPLSLRADVEKCTAYQWMRNGRQIGGAESVEYRLESATVEDSGFYSVVCSNEFGTVTSSPVWVDVQGPLRFVNVLRPTVSRVGGRALYSVQVSQGSGVDFRWLVNGSPIDFSGVGLPSELAGARVSCVSFRGTSFLELSRLPSGMVGQISVEVRSSAGDVLIGGPVSLRVESLIPRYR